MRGLIQITLIVFNTVLYLHIASIVLNAGGLCQYRYMRITSRVVYPDLDFV